MTSVLVVGLGKSGAAAANLLARDCNVSAWDQKKEVYLSINMVEHLRNLGVQLYFEDIPQDMNFDYLVLSPGVPLDSEIVRRGLECGAKITGELELAYGYSEGSFYAITGTNGKTTTTTLVGEIMKAAGASAKVVGNIGNPATEEAICPKGTIMVTEVSSFQLETTSTFKPEVSAILNITPDHLDRHKTMAEYRRVKHLIHANQDENDFFVFNADDEELLNETLAMDIKAKLVPFSHKKTKEEMQKIAGPDSFYAFCRGNDVYLGSPNGTSLLISTNQIIIPGVHNLENALAAAAMCYCKGVGVSVIRSVLSTFKGVEHRMEDAGTVNGVKYINDSKGTNPDASIKALNAVKTKIILIAGGYDKRVPFDDYVKAFDGKVRKLLLIGQTAKEIAIVAEQYGFDPKDMYFCENMRECVRKAYELAWPGETVLLSPACASWGMYNHFEERGDEFKALVKDLFNFKIE